MYFASLEDEGGCGSVAEEEGGSRSFWRKRRWREGLGGGGTGLWVCGESLGCLGGFWGDVN